METRIFRATREVMNAVAQLVEERDDFVMLEQGGLSSCRFAKVANKCGSRVSAGTIWIEVAGLEGEVGGMAIFARTRVQIQIEVTNEGSSFTFVIPDGEDFHVLMPSDISSFVGFYFC